MPPILHPHMLVTLGGDGLLVVYTIREERREEGVVVELDEVVIRDARGGLLDCGFGEGGVLGVVGEEGVLRVYRCGGRGGGGWGLLTEVDVGACGGVSFAPGGKHCVVGGVIVRKGVMEWEWEICGEVEDVQRIVCVDWGNVGFIGVGREDGGVEVWQMKGGKLKKVARVEGEGRVRKIAWDAVGGVLATAHEDGGVRTWARKPGEMLGEWKWELRDCVEMEEGG